MTTAVQSSQPPIPAATLVLVRDQLGASPELLMVQRSEAMVFAGGAVVFPGGRVDADDYQLAKRYPDIEPDCAAARIAAIRETLEESGVHVGLVGSVDHAWLGVAREALHRGEKFSALIDAAGHGLDLDILVPFARWCPNFTETRTFDTRFYLARATDDLPEASVDATENVRLFWSSAQDSLDAAERNELRIIFPTKRNLERLAQFDNFDTAKAHAETIAVELICPWVEHDGDDVYLSIPEGLGYPITRESLKTAHRAGK